MLGLGFLALLLAANGTTTCTGDDPHHEAREIIEDVQRIVTPDGIDETIEVELGGVPQVVNIRGTDRDNPILIYVHGGPGSVEMPMAWSFQRPWEDYFTVVQWDQRGAGRSYRLTDPETVRQSLAPERYVRDAIELVEYLTQRYGQEKVFLLGHSWGSAIGLNVAAERPDLLYAYIGMGQIIDFRENERVGIERTLKAARADGNEQAIEEIEALRPYPDDGDFTIEKADTWRKWANQYGSLTAYRGDAGFYFDSTKLSPLYCPEDRIAWIEGSSMTVQTLWPQLADVSFFDLNAVDVPVFLIMGRHDTTTPSSIAYDWLSKLDAPEKEFIWFEDSGHLPMIEEPGRFLVTLVNDVRPLAQPVDPVQDE